jgi:hypothetical protein
MGFDPIELEPYREPSAILSQTRQEFLGIGPLFNFESPRPHDMDVDMIALLTQAKPLNSIYGSRGRIFQAKAATGIGPSQAVAVASVDGGIR